MLTKKFESECACVCAGRGCFGKGLRPFALLWSVQESWDQKTVRRCFLIWWQFSSRPDTERVVNCPTRWSLLFIFGFLYWSSSWRLGPHIGVCRLLWPLLRAGMAVLTHFFCKMYFLYASRSRKKNLTTFLGVLPLQKKVFFQSLGPARVFQKLRSPHRRYSAYFEKLYF